MAMRAFRGDSSPMLPVSMSDYKEDSRRPRRQGGCPLVLTLALLAIAVGNGWKWFEEAAARGEAERALGVQRAEAVGREDEHGRARKVAEDAAKQAEERHAAQLAEAQASAQARHASLEEAAAAANRSLDEARGESQAAQQTTQQLQKELGEVRSRLEADLTAVKAELERAKGEAQQREASAAEKVEQAKTERERFNEWQAGRYAALQAQCNVTKADWDRCKESLAKKEADAEACEKEKAECAEKRAGADEDAQRLQKQLAKSEKRQAKLQGKVDDLRKQVEGLVEDHTAGIDRLSQAAAGLDKKAAREEEKLTDFDSQHKERKNLIDSLRQRISTPAPPEGGADEAADTAQSQSQQSQQDRVPVELLPIDGKKIQLNDGAEGAEKEAAGGEAAEQKQEQKPKAEEGKAEDLNPQQSRAEEQDAPPPTPVPASSSDL